MQKSLLKKKATHPRHAFATKSAFCLKNMSTNGLHQMISAIIANRKDIGNGIVPFSSKGQGNKISTLFNPTVTVQ